MSDTIKLEIERSKEIIKKSTGKEISDDLAFNHMVLKNVFDVSYEDHSDYVCDGANDGGIDFVFFD